MDKIFSNGEALSLLGRIALLNEELDNLVNNCALDDLYCYLPCVEGASSEPKEPILYPKISISLDYKEAYHILMEIRQRASEEKDFGRYLAVAKLIASLGSLGTEIEDKNKN